MIRVCTFLTISIAILCLSSCQMNQKTMQQVMHKTSPIGSWEMLEVHWVLADTTYSIKKAQPGLFIFEADRYSIMWTPIEKPRTPFQNLSKPTKEEMQSGFRSVVFNGGTFQMTDSTITTTANIAKVPGFEGGKQFYRYTIETDILTLTMFDETYPAGKKPEWSGRVETKFVMKRAK